MTCPHQLWGKADASPFHELGIPSLSFTTTKGYSHLHQICDVPETLNPESFEQAARLAFVTKWIAADGHSIIVAQVVVL